MGSRALQNGRKCTPHASVRRSRAGDDRPLLQPYGGCSPHWIYGSEAAGDVPAEADIGLYGSFATTGRGHGTDRALVAGLLGLRPDDPRLPDSFALAEEAA